MREPVGRTWLPTTVLRFGAVPAASGPVILTAFGIGGEGLPWFCSATPPATADGPGLLIAQADAPYALGRTPGELLFWGVLLLPVVVAALLRRGSRRAVLTAATAVGAVLALGLLVAFLLPGIDPCTGRERAAMPPWPLIVCYPVAAGALLLAARSSLPPGRRGIVLWAGAAGAAAWTAMFHRASVSFGGFREATAVYADVGESRPWESLAWWSYDADAVGLPVVLVASAAAVWAAAPARWVRPAAAGAAAALLLFPMLDIASYIDRCGGVFPASFAASVRWHLLLAAALVAAAVRHPETRSSGTGIVRPAWRVVRGRDAVLSRRARDLTVAVVVAAAAVWLVSSSFAPTR
ncbi:hypothetical protein [Streptosporangium sandarakinum]|uniref:hypothetical protein n=1 Tax=Streptosporangium sandarakinum TaxID=1260955 RepID=UPI003428F81B